LGIEAIHSSVTLALDKAGVSVTPGYFIPWKEPSVPIEKEVG